jgi:hypothetical protein
VLTFHFLLDYTQSNLKKDNTKSQSVPGTPNQSQNQKNVPLLSALQLLVEDSSVIVAPTGEQKQEPALDGAAGRGRALSDTPRARNNNANNTNQNTNGVPPNAPVKNAPSGSAVSTPQKSPEDEVKELKQKLRDETELTKLLQLQIEKWRDDNKKLYMGHVQKNILQQERIDELTAQIHTLSRENALLKLGLQRSPNSAANQQKAAWPKPPTANNTGSNTSAPSTNSPQNAQRSLTSSNPPSIAEQRTLIQQGSINGLNVPVNPARRTSR